MHRHSSANACDNCWREVVFVYGHYSTLVESLAVRRLMAAISSFTYMGTVVGSREPVGVRVAY